MGVSCPSVEGSTVNIYPGAPHGFPMTLAGQLNADLIDFHPALGRS